MAYNMTAFQASQNVYQQFVAINDISGNLLVGLTLFSLFIILVMRLQHNNPPAESFTSAAAVCSLLSLFFLAIDLIGIIWVIGFTLTFAISGVALYIQNRF